VRLVVKTEQQLSHAAKAIKDALAAHADRGLMVTIEPFHPPRTYSQNAMLHALIGELADASGYADTEELKELLKVEFWPTKTIKLAKRDVTVPKSTAELSREECSVVIEKILYIAAEMGFPLKTR